MKKWSGRILALVIAVSAIYYFMPDTELPSNIKIDKLSRRAKE